MSKFKLKFFICETYVTHVEAHIRLGCGIHLINSPHGTPMRSMF